MKDYRRRVITGTISFRALVKDCAGEPQLVESFNRAFGAHLKAPIAALAEDHWPLQISPEEEMQIGFFIVFVYQQIWLRLQRAKTRLGDELRASGMATVQPP